MSKSIKFARNLAKESAMFNCHNHLTAYHNKKVTLSQTERSEMRERRDTNRNRIKNWLKSNRDLKPAFFESQGSYKDKTMVQYPDKDYDIDDGVYFCEDDLVNRNNNPLTALYVRKLICEALTDSSFNSPPKLHTNCIRVTYIKGYNVDVTVYRVKEDGVAELASSDWKPSDARLASNWFNHFNKKHSPGEENGRQFRRIVRLIKKITSNRKSWRLRVTSGFGVTILASECYYPCKDRDDLSLLNTLTNIRGRLHQNLSIKNPVPPNDYIAKNDNARSKYLRESLDKLSDCFKKIDQTDSEYESLCAWSEIFGDKYFRERMKNTNQEKSISKIEPATAVVKAPGRTNA